MGCLRGDGGVQAGCKNAGMDLYLILWQFNRIEIPIAAEGPYKRRQFLNVTIKQENCINRVI